MNGQNNITATGIAVALAVVVALALLFFGPALFAFINGSPAAGTASSTQATDQMAGQAAQAPTTNQPTTAGVPAQQAMQYPDHVTELEGKDITVGTGATAEAGDTVTVQYVGMFPDGKVFDASKNHGDQGFSFKLGAGQVIKGWDQGVAGMKVGGERLLIIPPSLGYGSQDNGPIPANSTLVFQVQLLDVKK